MNRGHARTALSVVSSSTIFAIALSANAQTAGRKYFQTTTFGIVGLARNQVARLNVLNPGNAYGIQNRTCSADMEFRDDQDRELKTATAEVDWGKAVSLQVDQHEIGNDALRVQIRAVVKTAISQPDASATSSVMPGAVCSFLPTLEVFDKDTGKTTLILSEGRSIILNTPSNIPASPSAR